MNFDVFGGFPISGAGVDFEFWQSVDKERSGLSRACGCYIFAIRNGNNVMAWYVGKTEKQTFRARMSSRAHRSRLKRLSEEYGELQIVLLAALTNTGRFMQPRENGCPDIDFLEKMLIGMALRKNAKLSNIAITRMLNNMSVPGVLNSRPGQPTRAARVLKNALGIS